MTQWNHNSKVILNKLLLDEVNYKHLQTNSNNKASLAEAATNLQPFVLPDSECNKVRTVVAGLLELQTTDNQEVMTSKNIDINKSTDSRCTNYDDEPDFSVVEKQHIDDSSISRNGSGE